MRLLLFGYRVPYSSKLQSTSTAAAVPLEDTGTVTINYKKIYIYFLFKKPLDIVADLPCSVPLPVPVPVPVVHRHPHRSLPHHFLPFQIVPFRQFFRIVPAQHFKFRFTAQFTARLAKPKQFVAVVPMRQDRQKPTHHVGIPHHLSQMHHER